MLTIKSKLSEIEGKLKSNPKGFDLDDYYMCIVCSKVVGSGKGWYDKLGPKCLVCQRAVEKGIVPSQVCLERGSWLAMWEVNQLGYHPRVIRMMMKNDKLKAIVIRNFSDEIYFYIFLKKENQAIDVIL